MRTAVVLVCSMSLLGCAAVFRGSKDNVVVDSDPAGAEAKKGDRDLGVTPMVIPVERRGATQIKLTKKGFDEHYGTIPKKVNAAWVVLDILTCPVALCIPLIIDAATGAWVDVDHKYSAQLTPSATGGTTTAPFKPATGPTPTPTASTTLAGPPTDMSESERKATARAAYTAGIALQEKGACPGALAKFETAQRYFQAPTHLLHMGQCQAAIGKLVEATETYETLLHVPLAAEASEAFRQAQEDGRRDLAHLKPRLPTLRVQTTPPSTALAGLVVKMNDVTIPNELLGVLRPVNPGTYKVTIWATGYKEASQRVDLGEGATQSVVLHLTR